MVRITIKNLSKKFDRIAAVNSLYLSVEDGEFFVLVGPNGCGKTTLLKLIAGLLKPDEGEIYFDNLLVNDLKPPERGVRMVFEGYALFPHMKVYEEMRYSNLNFALKVRKTKIEKIRNVINAVSSRVGIERKLYNRKPDELSQGEKQKVAVGKAITILPKVFLMDEPVSNLDPSTRIHVMQELRRLHEDLKTTTIYVTHNLAEAMVIADRLAVMMDGAIRQVGAPDEVRNHPIDESVADFIKYYDYASLLRAFNKA
ncbi:MAG: ABC transporter ATP-binding protein [Candidatus Bathyarchaeia archaeon]